MSINLQVNNLQTGNGAFAESNHSSTSVAQDETVKAQEISRAETSVDKTVEVKEAKEVKDAAKVIAQQELKAANKSQSDPDVEQETQQLKDAMAIISEFLNIPIRSVNFAEHDGTDKTVIKIFDRENQELIKQFPSDEILSIAQRIAELQQDVGARTGILLDESI
jgi:flagellar protein FlaG